ncbi:hypothetical protein RU94_GL001760 [Enterococcus asini]|nr:hypothetical protein RU94_GL001760 [Enterococcus asini]
MTKVYAGFKQLFHRDYCHFVFPPIWFFPSSTDYPCWELQVAAPPSKYQ